mmetsp:Transcript_6528/g.11259  ORF Transcript_6528/g.11259 Transcript_6528/m.11259 type:complete len:365 (+) Transcript_6528:270-1364(+)
MSNDHPFVVRDSETIHGAATNSASIANNEPPTNISALKNIGAGLSIAAEGLVASLTIPHLRARLLKAVVFLGLFTFVLYLFLEVFVFFAAGVLTLTLSVLSMLGVTSSSSKASLSVKLRSFVTQSVLAVPNAGLFFCRYVYSAPLDALFLASLVSMARECDFPSSRSQRDDVPNGTNDTNDTNPNGADRQDSRRSRLEAFAASVVRMQPRGSVVDEATRFVARAARRAVVGLAVYLFSFLPRIGFLAVPVATYLLLSRSFRRPIAFVSATTLFFFPRIGPFKLNLAFSYLLALRSFGRELLEPYLSRARIEESQRRNWFSKYEAQLFGFELFYYTLLSLPYFGPFFFVTAQSSMALFLLRMCSE